MSNWDWKIFSGSYRIAAEEKISGIPLLSAHNLETETDKEVVLSKPIAVKAGMELGLIGEYNQMDEQDKKLLHLEVFTYDDIEAFQAIAKAQYEKDKAEKKLTDNFLYVARNSAYYSITENKAVKLGSTVTEIMVPLSETEKKTIKEGNATKDYYNIQPYLHNTTVKSKTGIYVDNSHVTHGILFPGVNIFKQQSDGLCIFKNGLHENLNPASDLTAKQKDELTPLFKAIMDELDLEKDNGTPVIFEAGKLKNLLLDSIQQRRLTGIIAKHESEWKSTRQADFAKVCDLYRRYNDEETAKRINKRVEDLSIKLKVNQFDTDKEAHYIHPLGFVGWLAAPRAEFDWFETPLVKLIVSKESKGSYNAYNITGWDAEGRNKIYESHFEPTVQYHLEKMTIKEIRTAQDTYIGSNKKHMQAVGIFQMIPSTLGQFLRWLKSYKTIDENSQLFDRNFQQLTPLFFWEIKRSIISGYFRNKNTVEEAAYEVAQEWASAAVPKGKRVKPKKKGELGRISDGTISYYDSDGLNKAHYSAEFTIKALEETKKMIDDIGGYEAVRNVTLEILNN
ncbi:hypothetical protein [Cricetibacter osteomyelitidis]|uniref:hypothetical protein n=1 Tax=Cricetibacter osteomyelitidis TaxID=1521931 RepID=UPI001FB44DF0|nr:hypothetical protein [Cricetibacter osteomyelitidis]